MTSLTTQYHLGGMVYSCNKGKGVRKYIPPPCEVEFLPSATLQDVLKAGKRKFFADDDKISLSCLPLADSYGSRIDIDDEESWTIDFYAQYDYKPSRYNLYVMYVPPVNHCVNSMLKLWWFSYWRQSSSSEDELLNIYRRRVVPTTGEGTSRGSHDNTPVGRSHDTPVGPSPPTFSISRKCRGPLLVRICVLCVIGNGQLIHKWLWCSSHVNVMTFTWFFSHLQQRRQRQSLACVPVVGNFTTSFLTHFALCQMGQLYTTRTLKPTMWWLQAGLAVQCITFSRIRGQENIHSCLQVISVPSH